MRGRRLILAAGSPGTPAMLLRNRASLGALSERLGWDFQPDCDAFGGWSGRQRAADHHEGPTTSAALRRPDGTVSVDDAAYPEVLEWIRRALPPQQFGSRRGSPGSALFQAVARGDHQPGRMHLLAIGDTAGAQRLRLGTRGAVEVEQVGESPPDASAARALEELGATLAPDALRLHAVGGCMMAESPADGVVDPFGNVFGLPNLHVADASVLPTPLGVGPALTIAALAERCAADIVQRA